MSYNLKLSIWADFSLVENKTVTGLPPPAPFAWAYFKKVIKIINIIPGTPMDEKGRLIDIHHCVCDQKGFASGPVF